MQANLYENNPFCTFHNGAKSQKPGRNSKSCSEAFGGADHKYVVRFYQCQHGGLVRRMHIWKIIVNLTRLSEVDHPGVFGVADHETVVRFD